MEYMTNSKKPNKYFYDILNPHLAQPIKKRAETKLCMTLVMRHTHHMSRYLDELISPNDLVFIYVCSDRNIA